MKSLRVGFSRHSGLFSYTIMRATNSDVSHTYLRIPTEYNEDVIFQASGFKVNYCNGTVFARNNTIVEEYDVEVSDEQWAIAEKFRVTEVGKPYSMKQILGFAVIIGMHAMGKYTINPLGDDSDTYICTEVVARCIGLDKSESWSPEDLRRWCKKSAKNVFNLAS